MPPTSRPPKPRVSGENHGSPPPQQSTTLSTVTRLSPLIPALATPWQRQRIWDGRLRVAAPLPLGSFKACSRQSRQSNASSTPSSPTTCSVPRRRTRLTTSSSPSFPHWSAPARHARPQPPAPPLSYLQQPPQRTSRWSSHTRRDQASSSRPSTRQRRHSSSGKITFGLAAALWSASVGFSAIQDTLNTVYKVPEIPPLLEVSRLSAIGVTLILSVHRHPACSATMLGGDFVAALALYPHRKPAAPQWLSPDRRWRRPDRVVGWTAWSIASLLCILIFAVIYYFAPGRQGEQGLALALPRSRHRHLHGWFLGFASACASTCTYFDNYSVTYGSLGAVIVLLTWFYLTGLMLLLGAEINSRDRSRSRRVPPQGRRRPSPPRHHRRLHPHRLHPRRLTNSKRT